MAKLERIIIRIDTETGAALRSWFASQGTTLAGAIQGFLLEELEKSQSANASAEPAPPGSAFPGSKTERYGGKHLRRGELQHAQSAENARSAQNAGNDAPQDALPEDIPQEDGIKIPMTRRGAAPAGAFSVAQAPAGAPSAGEPRAASEALADNAPSELPYRAIVFDMDGTILDTLEDLYRAVNHGLASQGLPPRTREEVRQTVGNGYRNLMKWSCPEGTPQAVIDEVFAAFSAYYAEHCNDHTHPYPGIVELLGTLHKKGIKLAVLSNKGDAAVQELARLHFAGLFDAVCGQRDDLPRKPHRAMADRVLKEMGASTQNACYVGDSEVDILCAANAELPLWLVTWGFREPEQLIAAGAAPGELIGSVAELEQTLTQP